MFADRKVGRRVKAKVYLLTQLLFLITDYKHSTFVVGTWQVDFSPSMHWMETKLLTSLKLAVAVLIAVFSLAVWAKPAPWYWWASKVENTRLCLQTSPGNGWYRDGGPYRNSRCNDFVPR